MSLTTNLYLGAYYSRVTEATQSREAVQRLLHESPRRIRTFRK
jgi:hypothetical protein